MVIEPDKEGAALLQYISTVIANDPTHNSTQYFDFTIRNRRISGKVEITIQEVTPCQK